MVYSTLFPSSSNRRYNYHAIDSNRSEVARITGPTNAAKLPLLPTQPANTKVTKRLTPKELRLKGQKGNVFGVMKSFFLDISVRIDNLLS